MGCDIHHFVERRVDGRWVLVAGDVLPMWRGKYDPWGETSFVFPEDIPLDPKSVPKGVKRTDLMYDWYMEGGHPLNLERNYNIFALLADVRNNPKGDDFHIVPIHEQRGLPEGMCPEAVGYLGTDGRDYHSNSWCTLGELLAYPWDTGCERHVLMGWKDYLKYRKTKRISKVLREGIQWDNSATVNIVSMEEMDALCADLPKLSPEERVGFSAAHQLGNFRVYLEWNQSVLPECSKLHDMLPHLERIAAGDPDSVRLVYGFDN